ncbi:cytidylyltransferase domain-containing protein [Leifsonia sp. NPDC058230]|uniref:cytidylyltransferase domain-containing protein n=1 Tax=Leifsonia sp. NPDC058230 TaxID=3346391 RepID=UPI0036D9B22B
MPIPPNVVAVIPARAGSKGIPEKNLARVAGRPLIARAVAAAVAARTIDSVYVTTDGPGIAAEAKRAGAQIVDRPQAIAGDLATSESALLHALDLLACDGVEPDVLVFIQATSPFIDPDDLDAAVERVRSGDADVVFSVVRSHAFLWRMLDGTATAVNHDAATRPRRQDREPEYRETGAFYVMDARGFREHGHRFFGRVAVAEVSATGSIDIDDPADLLAASAIAPLLGTTDRIDVDAVVTDFDGVHTDDRASVHTDGTETVVVNRRDGMGVRLLREAGVPVLILSTETNPVVAARAAKLRVEVLHGVDDKATALREWAAASGIPLDRVAYLGNDINDLGALGIVGWPLAVADAHPLVIGAARRVLDRRGGDGAVRELADLVLIQRSGAS